MRNKEVLLYLRGATTTSAYATPRTAFHAAFSRTLHSPRPTHHMSSTRFPRPVPVSRVKFQFPGKRVELLASASLLLALLGLLAQAAASVLIQLLRPETGMRQIEAEIGDREGLLHPKTGPRQVPVAE